MKKLIFIFFFLFVQIVLAQDVDELLTIFSVPAIDQKYPLTSPSKIKEIEQKILETSGISEDNRIYQLKTQKVPSITTGGVAKFTLIPQPDGKVEMKLLYTEDFLKSSSAIVDAQKISTNIFIQYDTALLEIMTNAHQGASDALATLVSFHLKQDYFYGSEQENAILDELNQYYSQKYTPIQTELVKKAKADKKLAIEKMAPKKAKWDQLDVAEKQLKDLISQGKRKEAVKLLKAYIPLELMGPAEKAQWEIWIDAMENPAPMKDRMLVVRGLDKGQFFKAADESLFLMAPVIIKNQGSYNRRLRSLSTMLEKDISLPQYGENLGVGGKASRLTNMYANHADQPLGSPFISFTNEIGVAQSFSQEGIALFAIDKRLITLSPKSYGGEFEHLATLFTFPDEYVAFLPQAELQVLDDLDDSEQAIKKRLQELAEKKLGKEVLKKTAEASLLNQNWMTPEEHFAIVAQKKANTDEYFKMRAREKFNNLLIKVSPNCGQHLEP